MLDKLARRNIKAWTLGGYGLTNALTGAIAIRQKLLSPAGTLDFLRSEQAAYDRSLREIRQDEMRRGIQETPTQTRCRVYDLGWLIPYLSPGSPVIAEAQKMLVALILVGEIIHCRQGRRYLVVGDFVVLARARVQEYLYRHVNPAELEASEARHDFACDLRTRFFQGKSSPEYLSGRARWMASAANILYWIADQEAWKCTLIRRGPHGTLAPID